MSETASGLPPAGWYIQPAQPTVERWWDGAVWTDHSRAVVPVAPADAPPPADAAVVPPHPDASGAVRCPLCGRDDQLRRVSVVVAEGKTGTRGTAVTFARQDGRTRVAPTVYGSRGATDLSKRLSAPLRPHFPWYLHAAGWVLGTAVVAGVIGSVVIGSGSDAPASGTYIAGFVIFFFFGLFIGIAPAILFTIFAGAWQGPRVRARQEKWDQQSKRLDAAYFCFRDDVIVEDGRSYEPEKFISEAFEGARL